MTSPIHLFHANGFPSETYRDLLNNLEGEVESPITIIEVFEGRKTEKTQEYDQVEP